VLREDEANLPALFERLEKTGERTTRDTEDVLDALGLEDLQDGLGGRKLQNNGLRPNVSIHCWS
jgi:hypothetical protein